MTAESEIRRRIQQHGAITFAEFMEVALYWPDGGYYTSAEPFGASGDYYTSPMAHPAFGALLSLQLLQMWQITERPNPFYVIEMGAGNGQLCLDIITYSAHLPEEFQESLRYVCVDRRVNSAEGVRRAGGSLIAAEGVPLRGVRGCILSNELLDAFPVHQVEVERGRLREVYVTLDREALSETLGELSTPALAERLQSVDVELIEGQTAEINLELDCWAADVAQALDVGFALTIDYGQLAKELYSAEVRPRGTLTTYYRHTQTDTPLKRVGQQDMSAQVDFTSVVDAGRRSGLATVGFTTQGEFLNNLGLGRLQRRLASLGLPPKDLQANRALMDLVNPAGLGRFKVLIQSKNAGQTGLWGLKPSAEGAGLIDQLPFPLLTPQHIALVAGRYSQGEYEIALQELWPGDDTTTGKDTPSAT